MPTTALRSLRARPLTRLRDAILGMQPTAYWPCDDDSNSLLRDITGHGWDATPSATNEVQTVTIGGSGLGGSFTLTFNGQTTGPIAWSATNATLLANVDAALEALSSIGAGGVVCAATTLTAGIGAFTVTFSGTNVKRRDVPQMTADATLMTGSSPTVSVVTTTAGAGPTFRAAAPDPIGRAVTWGSSSRFADTSSSVTTPATAFSAILAFRQPAAALIDPMARSDSWTMRLRGTGLLSGIMTNTVAGTFVAQTDASAVSMADGQWHLGGMTWDGTTMRVLVDRSSGSNTTTSGTWKAASTSVIRFGALIGDTAHHAYWADRALTPADFRYLTSLALG